MASLDVNGAFLITIGHGSGPEMWVSVSASAEDGTPFDFPSDPENSPIRLFVTLSAMFGAMQIPLRIVDVQIQERGFTGLHVQGPSDLGVTLDRVRASTIGIVVDDGTDRGQTLACSCAGADVTSWFGERVQEPNQ